MTRRCHQRGSSAVPRMFWKVQLVATLFVGPPTVTVILALASPRMLKPRLPVEFWKVVPCCQRQGRRTIVEEVEYRHDSSC